MDRRIDLIVALAMALIGLGIIWAASGIKSGMMRDPIGPRMAFYICGGMLASGGFWIAAGHLGIGRKRRAATDDGVADERGIPASAARAFALMVGAAAFGLALKPAGFLIATPLFMAFALALLGKRDIASVVIVPVVFTVSAFLVFSSALGVRLPLGPLTEPFRALGWVTL